MFQKKIIEKYRSRIDGGLLSEKYALFRATFADSEKQRNIRASKEEQYQEGFIRDLFCSCLGYTIKPEANYNILTELKNESKAGDSKKSDGAIILNGEVKAVIELKGCDTQDLDRVAFQAFSYKNHHEKCNYVIVANFERLRLYVETQIEYEEFNLFNLSKERFDLLYLLLSLQSITNDVPLKLKHETVSEEKEITNNFYADYSAFKRALFEDLCENNLSESATTVIEPVEMTSMADTVVSTGSTTEKIHSTIANSALDIDKLTLFKKTQKLLDRILFVLFCEDRNLLPANSALGIIQDWKQLKKLGYPQPLYALFKTFFERINTGFVNEDDHSRDVFAYNGGLFKPDPVLDAITIGDDVLFIHTQRLAAYDFESQISVDILGRIFENSLTEIEEVQAELRNERHSERSEESSPVILNEREESADRDVSVASLPQHDGGVVPQHGAKTSTIGKRKKDGVFYTPEYITRYIVENTIGELCRKKREELGLTDEAIAEYASQAAQSKKTRKSRK